MGKYLLYAILGLLLVTGIGFVAYWGVQPRPIEKIRLSVFPSTKAAANSILLRLRPELQASPVVLWGLDPDQPDLVKVLTDFLETNQDPTTAFQVLVLDKNLERAAPELQALAGERIDTLSEMDRLTEGLRNFQASHMRTLVILPTVYAAALLPGSAAEQLKSRGLVTLDLLFSPFPRRRELESEMPVPCNVGGQDQTGTSRLGCEIVATARTHYRKTFHSGELVGLLNQIGQNDFLFLLSREP